MDSSGPSRTGTPAIKVKAENGDVKPMLTASGRRVRPPRAPLVNAEALASTTLDTKLLENFEGKGQQRMWLVKVPKFLAQHWMEKGKNGPVELGTISVDKVRKAPSASSAVKNGSPANGGVKTEGAIESRIRITVPDVLNPDGSRKMPRQYECSFKADSLGNEYAFVEDDRGAATMIAGKVIKELQARPTMDRDYVSLIRGRTESALRPARETLTINATETNRLEAIGMQTKPKEDGFTLRRDPKKARRDVNVRTDTVSELHRLILNYFRGTELTTLDVLAQNLKQPKSYMAENLPTVATQIKQGTYRGYWRLKDEYREFLEQEAREAAGIDDDLLGGGGTGMESEDLDEDDEDEDEEMAEAY